MKVIELLKAEKLEGEKYTLYRLVNPVTVGSKNLMSFFVTIDVGGEIPEHKLGPAEVVLPDFSTSWIFGHLNHPASWLYYLTIINFCRGLKNKNQRK